MEGIAPSLESIMLLVLSLVFGLWASFLLERSQDNRQ